jgi:NADH dehydrogenase
VEGKRPRVVIVGGGFGGLNAARALAKAPVDVILVDRRNHHLFQPLLYQVATAGLSPADIAEPIRRILRKQKNATVLMADARGVDVANKRLLLDEGGLDYDYVILACGVTHSWFGNDEWAKHSLGLKTLEDALSIRRQVLLAYERAERETDPARRAELLTFAVVGGGPTGVEMAGALAEIARQSLAKDFRHIDPSSAKVYLIEAGPRVLSAYDESLSRKAQDSLEKMGVIVRVNTRVQNITEGEISLADGPLRTSTIIWAAGVQAAPIARSLGVPLDNAGRVKVEPDFSIPGHAEVFAIGDMASLKDTAGVVVPGVCQGAIQAGHLVAKNIARTLRGEARQPMRYRDLGMMATIGRNRAIVQFPWWKLSGIFAWLMWAFLHIALLIGFDNRLVVMIEWMWSWFTFDRGARLITHEQGETAPPAK